MPIDLNTLKQIIHEAGSIIREVNISSEQISSKEGHRNFVTSYDIEVQDFLESRFRKLWPDYHFVAEEQDTHKLKQQSKEPPLDRAMTILAAGPKVYAEMQKLLGFKSNF